MKVWILVHPERGVFLGCALGLAFWSKWDPAGQDSAPAVTDPLMWAQDTLGQILLTEGAIPEEVEAERSDYATVAEIEAAGLPGWDPEALGLAEQRERGLVGSATPHTDAVKEMLGG